FVGAEIELAADGTLVLTGTLSVDAMPWLTDHSIMDSALLPATAMVEIAAHAGERVGHPQVAELTLHTPLVLPAGGGVGIQASVRPDGDTRTVTIHARTGSGPWTLH